MIKRIDLSEARPGDILVFKGEGLVYQVLSWLVKKIKEPKYDRWGWHMAPLVAHNIYLDTIWPKITLTELSEALRECRAYRIFDEQPPQEKINEFVLNHIGCWYDAVVYPLTTLAVLLRPHIDVPRIINRRYSCWETTFEFADCMGLDITPPYHYPFITDLLKLAGEC